MKHILGELDPLSIRHCICEQEHLVSGDQITSELRKRQKPDIFKTVYGSSKGLIAQKVRLEEADGWTAVKKNPKSTRMAKAKPADEQLEDEVWCILAQMGFTELSHGRQFTIAVGPGIPRRQIDVFAKDDETAIIVECTQRESPSKQRMTPLIDKIAAIRDDLLESIRKTYGRGSKLKVKLAIATRNIVWRDVDRAKCDIEQIAVIADGELDYYRLLVQHLKRAARYQFLGHMFGGQRVAGLDRKVVATRGKMGGDRFFTFLIRPDELLKIAYIGHKASRDIDDLETYQRMLQPRRLNKISDYINAGHRFPTNIVVNLKTTRRGGLRFDTSETYGEVALGTLHLPPNYGSAWIISLW